MDRPIAIVLAAGMSKRFKSERPKVIHEIAGRPMIDYVLDAARSAGVERMVLVIGHRAELVRSALAHHDDVEFALQENPRGTGHAVMMCRDQLSRHNGLVLILAGDTPLLRGASLAGLIDEQRSHSAACVIGTAVTDANEGLGRIVRDANGAFLEIVEHNDATDEQRLINEINTGCFVFESAALVDALGRLQPNNEQGEYYLTDCPAILKGDGRTVVAARRLDIVEAMGVNTRVQMAEIEGTLQARTRTRLMLDGVTLVQPDQTYVDPRARIGQDTVIHPFTSIVGEAVIGKNCRIGPHALILGPVCLADGSRVGAFEVVSED